MGVHTAHTPSPALKNKEVIETEGVHGMHTPISGAKEAIKTTTNCARIVQLDLLYHNPACPGNYLSINSGNPQRSFLY